MKKLGGNTDCILQKATYTANEIGEKEAVWRNWVTLHGYLDMQSGTSRWNYDAEVAEATHVFMSDYHEDVHTVDPSLLRAMIGGRAYTVLYIDNPVGRGMMTEIYLQRVDLDNAGESD